MADPKPVVYPKSLSLDELQTLIRNREAANKSLDKIDIVKVVEKADVEPEIWTIAYYKREVVAIRSLHLQADTDDGMYPPDDMTLVCRGRAMIAGTETPVVAFREK